MDDASVLVIGVVGGIASGKSLVSTFLQDHGAVVLDADKAGHQVLEEPDVIDVLRRRWGDRILKPDGHVDRSAVAKIVFGSSLSETAASEYTSTENPSSELAFLEEITHPKIGRKLEAQINALANERSLDAMRPVAVLDAPVMFKAGWDRLCDQILYVDAPREVRLARVLQRGWTEQQFTAREAAQEPLSIKRARADAVIDNSGTSEATHAQVQGFWKALWA